MSIVGRARKLLPFLLLLAIATAFAGRLEAQTPMKAKVMSIGQGWRLLNVGPDPEVTSGTMMWEVSEEGVKFLPVSQLQKDILTDAFAIDPDGTEGLLFFSKEMLEAMESPTFPQGYEQYIDPNEPLEIDSKSLFGCSWHDETRNRSWNYSHSLLNQSLPFSGAIDGSLNLDLPITGTLNLAARYKIQKCFGVPTGFEFVDAVASGTAQIAGTGDLTASATASANWNREWLLTEPELGEVSFTVGVIPVRLVFTLPIFAGVDLSAKISGQLAAHLNASASGTFTYTCTTHSCTGTSNFTDQFSFTGPNASATVDLSAQAHARVMLRVGIYDEHIAYVEGGLKAYAKAGVWGYIGNTCGDADEDGTNETVRALAADLVWGYRFAYGWGGWLLPDTLNFTGGSEYPLGWTDLLGNGGSTALQPMLTGPSTAVQGQPANYVVKMRPCYPYTQAVNVYVDPGVWTGPGTVSPSGSAALQTTFANTGNVTATATATSDSYGRGLNMPYSRVINVTPATPTAATLSGTVLSATSVRLNWTDSNSYKTGYEIQRRVTGGSFSWLTTVSSTTSTYTDTTVLPSTSYDYKIRVLNAGVNSPYSNVVTLTTNATIPAAPASLTASPQSATSVALAWADNSNNETSFEVQRRVLPSGVFGALVSTAANAVSYTDTSATANTSYEYRVRAVNSAGASSFSNVATATTGQTVPAAPSGLAATYNSGSKQFTLTWVDNSTNEQGFVPQFSFSGSAFSDLVNPVGANVTTYVSGANPPVGSYQFRVRAYNAAGSSAYSNTVSLLVVNPGNGAGYLGCYTDTATRALPVQIAGTTHTIESCKQAAYNAGYRYAGLQYFGYCFAGNTLGYTQVSDTECSTTCTANSAQICGGAWRNSIYSTGYNPPTPATSIAWIQPAENAWGPAGTLTAAGYATNGTGTVTLVWRERSSAGVWGAWNTVAYSAPVSPDTTWSNTISSGNPTNKCHWFDAYTTYSGATSPVFHYTGWTGCP